jgi:hypothetical protein
VDRRSEPERSDDRESTEYYLTAAKARAAQSPSGIGAAVVRSEPGARGHTWQCVVTDGNEWHYVEVMGPEAGFSADIPDEDIETTVERFAEGLPEDYRLGGVVNASPLQFTPDGGATG